MHSIWKIRTVVFAEFLFISGVMSAHLLAQEASLAPSPTKIQFPAKVTQSAKKVHVLIACLADDSTKGTQANRNFVEALFESEFSNTKDRLGKLHILNNDKFSTSAVWSAIEQLPVGNDDAIFCHISTHGGFDSKLGHFMTTSNGVLLRSELMTKLRQKNARLTVLCTDASTLTNLSDANRQVSIAEPATLETHALFNLLFHYKGTVDINSSSSPNAANPNGECSWYTNLADEHGGGVFTRSFCKSAIFAPADCDWEAFFRDVTRRMKSLNLPKDQNPMWFSN